MTAYKAAEHINTVGINNETDKECHIKPCKTYPNKSHSFPIWSYEPFVQPVNQEIDT